jgi:hypothetical protein
MLTTMLTMLTMLRAPLPIMRIPAGPGDCRWLVRPRRLLGALAVALAGVAAGAASMGAAAASASALPVATLSGALPGFAAPSTTGGVEEFFIISSLDPSRGRIVLKRPTEVTVTMRVTGQTAYRDEQGKALRLANLRAGATVFIAYRQEADGGSTAQLVRLGPMTVQLLHQRYLKPAAAPQ